MYIKPMCMYFLNGVYAVQSFTLSASFLLSEESGLSLYCWTGPQACLGYCKCLCECISGLNRLHNMCDEFSVVDNLLP